MMKISEAWVRQNQSCTRIEYVSDISTRWVLVGFLIPVFVIRFFYKQILVGVGEC